MDGQYLDSPDPRVRRLSAAVFAVATSCAALYLFGLFGVRGLLELGFNPVGWILVLGFAVIVWFVVAGVLLRVVRLIARRLRAQRVRPGASGSGGTLPT